MPLAREPLCDPHMNQLTRSQKRRVMYVENKSGEIDGAPGRIGWVTFSHSGLTVYYRGRTLKRLKGGGISGNHFDVETNDEYWISGIKKNGQDAHWASKIKVVVDEDAIDEYNRLLNEDSR
jgi:hypothetical protein